jgi:hypothetical protein
MTPFDKVRCTYDDVFNAFLLRELATDVNPTADDSYSIAEAALILVAFAHFEAEVNRRCSALISRKRKLADWKERRPWDGMDPKKPETLKFRDRLALLLDRGRAEYSTAIKLYDMRNAIAHGVDIEPARTFDDTLESLKDILSALEENP